MWPSLLVSPQQVQLVPSYLEPSLVARSRLASPSWPLEVSGDLRSRAAAAVVGMSDSLEDNDCHRSTEDSGLPMTAEGVVEHKAARARLVIAGLGHTVKCAWKPLKSVVEVIWLRGDV